MNGMEWVEDLDLFRYHICSMQMVNLRVSFIVIEAFIILDEVLHLQYSTVNYSSSHSFSDGHYLHDRAACDS